MILTVITRLLPVWESIRADGLASFLRERIWINRRAVIAEKDLLEGNGRKTFLFRSNLKFEEITQDKITSNNYQFPIKTRYLKALYYLKKGYAGHVLVKGNEVIGDIWHSATSEGDNLPVHPDVLRFGIGSSSGCAYSFDQFVVPAERGNKVAAALLSGQAYFLREKGYLKVRGYYWADNIPAVWNTRVMNRFKEVKILRFYRFIVLEKKFISNTTLTNRVKR